MLNLFISAAIAASEPPLLTLDELRAHPREHSGAIVRLAGQIDECWNMTCHICPLAATPAAPQRNRCLSIDFDRFPGGEDRYGADMDGAFRYADVVVTTRFDPACLTGICTDKATVLHDARVERVTKRRRSRDGLINRPDPLLPVAGEIAEPIRALVGYHDPNASVRIFTTRSDPSAQQSAVVCRALHGDGEVPQWPTSWQGAVTSRSTEDPYRCWHAQRTARGWVLEPG